MVDVDKAVIARLKVGNDVFEILVDCENAIKLKHGESIGLDKVVATDEIYKDVKKGDKASEHEVEKVFGTKDKDKVATDIIKKGEIHLTADYKNKLRKEIVKQIVYLIHRNAVDAQTGLPIPPLRIENALNESKVNIVESKTAEEQLDEIVKELRIQLPIKIEKRELEIKISPEFAGQSYHILKKFGNLIKEEYLSDGTLKVNIEIPSGISEEFESEINKLTHGNTEIKIVRKF